MSARGNAGARLLLRRFSSCAQRAQPFPFLSLSTQLAHDRCAARSKSGGRNRAKGSSSASLPFLEAPSPIASLPPSEDSLGERALVCIRIRTLLRALTEQRGTRRTASSATALV